MFPYLLLSIVFLPVAAGIVLASTRRRQGRFAQLLALLAVYFALYAAMLFFLRTRWVG